MEILIKAIQFILSISLLVLLHEGGHFAFSKLFGVRVNKFYMFFDWKFALFRKKIGQTEYGIGWIPLGGYCQIEGMIDETQLDKEKLAQAAQPYEFRSKPTWQRLLIMVGGVLVNFLLAMFIYSMVLFHWGQSYVATQDITNGMAFNDDAKALGFEDGDILLGTNEGAFTAFGAGLYRDLTSAKECYVLRPSAVTTSETAEDTASASLDTITIALPGNLDLLQMMQADPIFVSPNAPNEGEQYAVTHIEYGFFESFPAGIAYGWKVLCGYVSDLKYLFSADGVKNIGGFGTIGSLFPSTWDWHLFWMMTAFLSIILAFMNILPIPALDGGHILFLLWEMITRKKPSDNFMIYAEYVGFGILILLMVVANLNDILRWIGIM